MKKFAVWIDRTTKGVNYGQTGEIVKDKNSAHWIFTPHGQKESFVAIEAWDIVITNQDNISSRQPGVWAAIVSTNLSMWRNRIDASDTCATRDEEQSRLLP